METSFKTYWNDQNKIHILAVAAVILVVIACTQAYLLAKRPNLPDLAQPKIHEPAARPLAAMPSLTVPDALIIPDSSDVMVQMLNMQKAMDQLFAEQMRQRGGQNLPVLAVPNVDLREEKDRYVLRMDIPGADQGSLHVSIEGRTLTISGKRESVSEANEGKLVRQERSAGLFERKMQLPGSVKQSEMDAKYDKGVLTVNLPKDNTQTASKTIKVK